MVTAKVGEQSLAFLRVPEGAVTASKPLGWGGPKTADLPSFSVCRAAWKKAPQEELVSSDAEMIKKRSPPAVSSRLSRDLKGLDKLLAGDVSDDDDEEDDETEAEGSQAGYLAPGASRKKLQASKGKKKKEKPQTLDLQTLLQAGVASGSEPRDLLTMMVLNQLVNQQAKGSKQKKKKKRASSSNELLGGSSSDSSASGDSDHSDRGLKAVSSLHRLHEKIQKKPKRVCQIFEAECIKELGVVPGQAWTMRDFVKKQPRGRFKGLFRCAIMDVATSYELLRAGKADIAAAPTVQNLKSKMQAVLAGGDWEAAWLQRGCQIRRKRCRLCRAMWTPLPA